MPPSPNRQPSPSRAGWSHIRGTRPCKARRRSPTPRWGCRRDPPSRAERAPPATRRRASSWYPAQYRTTRNARASPTFRPPVLWSHRSTAAPRRRPGNARHSYVIARPTQARAHSGGPGSDGRGDRRRRARDDPVVGRAGEPIAVRATGARRAKYKILIRDSPGLSGINWDKWDSAGRAAADAGGSRSTEKRPLAATVAPCPPVCCMRDPGVGAARVAPHHGSVSGERTKAVPGQPMSARQASTMCRALMP